MAEFACCVCGAVPSTVIKWQGKWFCPNCDEVRRREEILASGTVIDDEGMACQGCLFGIRPVDVCVVDPHGDGPFHKNCAIACGHAPENVRIAPDEFIELEFEEFEKHGKRVYEQ
jgi:hypothetical protein